MNSPTLESVKGAAPAIYMLSMAFKKGGKDPAIEKTYRDMVKGTPLCKITGYRCRYIDCQDNSQKRSYE